MHITRATMVVAVLAATTACASTAPDPSPSTFTAVIEKYLEMARAQGAAPEQIDVMEAALTEGGVTMEQIVDLSTRVKDCLITAGFSVTDAGMSEALTGSGIMMPDYLAKEPDGMGDVAASAVMDDCDTKYLMYAQSAYMSQPGTLDQYYETFDTPEIRQCLIDHGYDVDEDATGQEINILTAQDANDHVSDPGYTPCNIHSP